MEGKAHDSTKLISILHKNCQRRRIPMDAETNTASNTRFWEENQIPKRFTNFLHHPNFQVNGHQTSSSHLLFVLIITFMVNTSSASPAGKSSLYPPSLFSFYSSFETTGLHLDKAHQPHQHNHLLHHQPFHDHHHIIHQDHQHQPLYQPQITRRYGLASLRQERGGGEGEEGQGRKVHHPSLEEHRHGQRGNLHNHPDWLDRHKDWHDFENLSRKMKNWLKGQVSSMTPSPLLTSTSDDVIRLPPVSYASHALSQLKNMSSGSQKPLTPLVPSFSIPNPPTPFFSKSTNQGNMRHVRNLKAPTPYLPRSPGFLDTSDIVVNPGFHHDPRSHPSFMTPGRIFPSYYPASDGSDGDSYDNPYPQASFPSSLSFSSGIASPPSCSSPSGYNSLHIPQPTFQTPQQQMPQKPVLQQQQVLTPPPPPTTTPSLYFRMMMPPSGQQQQTQTTAPQTHQNLQSPALPVSSPPSSSIPQGSHYPGQTAMGNQQSNGQNAGHSSNSAGGMIQRSGYTISLGNGVVIESSGGASPSSPPPPPPPPPPPSSNSITPSSSSSPTMPPALSPPSTMTNQQQQSMQPYQMGNQENQSPMMCHCHCDDGKNPPSILDMKVQPLSTTTTPASIQSLSTPNNGPTKVEIKYVPVLVPPGHTGVQPAHMQCSQCGATLDPLAPTFQVIEHADSYVTTSVDPLNNEPISSHDHPHQHIYHHQVPPTPLSSFSSPSPKYQETEEGIDTSLGHLSKFGNLSSYDDEQITPTGKIKSGNSFSPSTSHNNSIRKQHQPSALSPSSSSRHYETGNSSPSLEKKKKKKTSPGKGKNRYHSQRMTSSRHSKHLQTASSEEHDSGGDNNDAGNSSSIDSSSVAEHEVNDDENPTRIPSLSQEEKRHQQQVSSQDERQGENEENPSADDEQGKERGEDNEEETIPRQQHHDNKNNYTSNKDNGNQRNNRRGGSRRSSSFSSSKGSSSSGPHHRQRISNQSSDNNNNSNLQVKGQRRISHRRHNRSMMTTPKTKKEDNSGGGDKRRKKIKQIFGGTSPSLRLTSDFPPFSSSKSVGDKTRDDDHSDIVDYDGDERVGRKPLSSSAGGSFSSHAPMESEEEQEERSSGPDKQQEERQMTPEGDSQNEEENSYGVDNNSEDDGNIDENSNIKGEENPGMMEKRGAGGDQLDSRWTSTSAGPGVLSKSSWTQEAEKEEEGEKQLESPEKVEEEGGGEEENMTGIRGEISNVQKGRHRPPSPSSKLKMSSKKSEKTASLSRKMKSRGREVENEEEKSTLNRHEEDEERLKLGGGDGENSTDPKVKKEGEEEEEVEEENEKGNLPPSVKSHHRHPSPRQKESARRKSSGQQDKLPLKETGEKIGENDVFDWNQDDRSLSWKTGGEWWKEKEQFDKTTTLVEGKKEVLVDQFSKTDPETNTEPLLSLLDERVSRSKKDKDDIKDTLDTLFSHPDSPLYSPLTKLKYEYLQGLL